MGSISTNAMGRNAANDWLTRRTDQFHLDFTIHVAKLELPPIPAELARVAKNRLVFDGQKAPVAGRSEHHMRGDGALVQQTQARQIFHGRKPLHRRGEALPNKAPVQLVDQSVGLAQHGLLLGGALDVSSTPKSGDKPSRGQIDDWGARIALVAELLGGAKVLPRQEVDKLLDSRTRYGVKAKSGGTPGCPVVAEDLNGSEERFYVTREELIGLVDEALSAMETVLRKTVGRFRN